MSVTRSLLVRRSRLSVPWPALFLAGCASTQPMTWEDGAAAWLIRCDTVLATIADCYAEASGACPHGYRILAEGECKDEIRCPYGSLPVQRRYMVVQCQS